jgi:hypothetical protein
MKVPSWQNATVHRSRIATCSHRDRTSLADPLPPSTLRDRNGSFQGAKVIRVVSRVGQQVLGPLEISYMAEYLRISAAFPNHRSSAAVGG